MAKKTKKRTGVKWGVLGQKKTKKRTGGRFLQIKDLLVAGQPKGTE